MARYPSISETAAFKIEDFQYADSTIGFSAAKRVLLDPAHRDLILLKDEEVEVEEVIEVDTLNNVTRKTVEKKRFIKRTVQQKVRDLWDILQQMYDICKRYKEAPGVSIYGPSRDLEGWKFQDIVEGEFDMTAVKLKLDQDATKWHRLIRNINTVVLLGSDFGEIIRASGEFCKNWKSVPQGQCCLAIPVVLLKRICWKHGDPTTIPVTLAPHTYWSIRSHPFNCECNGRKAKKGGVCDRIQTLSAIKMINNSSGALDIFGSEHHDNGAVIFRGGKLRKKMDHSSSGSRSFPRLPKLFRSGNSNSSDTHENTR